MWKEASTLKTTLTSHFNTIPACGRRPETDGRTDGHMTTAYIALAVLRSKKSNGMCHHEGKLLCQTERNPPVTFMQNFAK